MDKKIRLMIKSEISRDDLCSIKEYCKGFERIKMCKESTLLIEAPVRIYEPTRLIATRPLLIGAYSYLMSARIRVTTHIGRYVSIARNVVIGEPAKIIRYRFDPEMINRLIKLQWWDLKPKYLSGMTFSQPKKLIKHLEILRADENPDCLKSEYVSIK